MNYTKMGKYKGKHIEKTKSYKSKGMMSEWE